MLVIFDFDNTLEEFAPYEQKVEDAIFAKLNAKYGIEPLKLRDVFDSIKHNHVHLRSVPRDYDRREWFQQLFHNFHLPEPSDTWAHIYWSRIEAEVRLFPKTLEILRELSAEHTVCLLSDSDGARSIKLRRLEQLGVLPYMDAVFTTDAVGHNKPHPRAFLQVLEHYRMSAEQAVMIGDNPPVDLQTAHELGIHTIWVQQGATTHLRRQNYAYVDVELETLEGLQATLSQLETKQGSVQKHEPQRKRSTHSSSSAVSKVAPTYRSFGT